MVSPIQNIFTKNLETICCVILAKTSQKMIVNLLMMVLIDLPIIKFTCQHHVSGYVCRVWHLGFFFLLLMEIISITKLFIIVHFFVLKHEKQTLSCIHTKFEGDKNTSFFFFSSLFCGSKNPFFCPNTENYLGLSGWCPWIYLVWIGLMSCTTTSDINLGHESCKMRAACVLCVDTFLQKLEFLFHVWATVKRFYKHFWVKKEKLNAGFPVKL